MPTFEDIMSALSTRHPTTLRRILANLPTINEDRLDSAQDYAQHLRRELGPQAFDLLTSQLEETSTRLGEGLDIGADEVEDALASPTSLGRMANKTADAVAAAYRQQQGLWSKLDESRDFITRLLPTPAKLLDIIHAHANSTVLIYSFFMALLISSSHTTSTIHEDSARGARARKKVWFGVALLLISLFASLTVAGAEGVSALGTYVFPMLCMGALAGRWRLLIPSSSLWPRYTPPADAAKIWLEALLHAMGFLFCSGFFAWVMIVLLKASADDEEWKVFED